MLPLQELVEEVKALLPEYPQLPEALLRDEPNVAIIASIFVRATAFARTEEEQAKIQALCAKWRKLEGLEPA